MLSASDTGTLPLVALVTAGLEDPAIEEIRECFGLAPGGVQLIGVPPPEDNRTPEAQGGIFAGASGVSKLRFEVPWPADEAALCRSVRSLKGAQGVLAPIALATVRFGERGCSTRVLPSPTGLSGRPCSRRGACSLSEGRPALRRAPSAARAYATAASTATMSLHYLNYFDKML